MTDQETDLVANLAIGHRDIEVLRDISQNADQRQAKLDKQLAKTGRYIRKIFKMVDGISKDQDEIAKEFFYRRLRNHPQIGSFHFNRIFGNWRVCRHSNGLEDEFHLILTNSDTLVLFEVKAKARVEVIKTMIDRKIPNLRNLLPFFREHKLYAGIANLVTDENLIKEVSEHGLFLITQQGTHLEVVNTQVRQF